MQNQSVIQDSLTSLIDVLNTQVFAEDQIEDTREHAHTSNLGCLSCTLFQRNSNFPDCHPSFPVDSFDHHTTSTSAIVFEAAIRVSEVSRLSSTIFLCPCAPMLAQLSASFVLFKCERRDLRGMEASYRLPCCGVSSSIDDSSCHLSGIPAPVSWWPVRHFALILNLKMSLMQPCFQRPCVHLLSTSPVMAM